MSESDDQSPDERGTVVPASTERFSTAVGWSFVMNTVQIMATLVTAFVLARLLGPEAFGTVALALIFIMLLDVLTRQGLGTAVIQRPNLTDLHLDSAFWMGMGAAGVLTTASLLLSGWWADLNGTPEAGPVIRVLSIMLIVRGLTVVQEALLERQLKYRQLALRTTIASASGAAAGIGFALVERTLWALVVQQVVTATVGVIVLWSVAIWRPRWRFSVDHARGLLTFSVKAALSSIATFVSTRIDALLVGVFFGAIAIGIYRLAERLVQSAVDLAARPVQRVGLPEFSRQQQVVDGPRNRYRHLVSLSAAIGATVMSITFACAEPLTRILGPEWAAAAGALQLLCGMGAVRVVTMLNGPAVVGAGQPGRHAAMMWLSAALGAATFFAAGVALADRGLEAQVLGMAASRLVLWAVILVPISQIWLIDRYVGVGFGEFLRIVAPALLGSTIVALLGAGLADLLASASVPALLALFIVGSATTAVVVPLNLWASPPARSVANRILVRLPIVGRTRAPADSGEASTVPTSEL